MSGIFGSGKAEKQQKKLAAEQKAAAEAAGRAQAEALRFNADVYRSNAEDVEVKSLLDESRTRKAASRFMGEQKSAIAASGFSQDGFEGIIEDTERELDLDAILVRREGQFQRADYLGQAALAEMQAVNAIEVGKKGGQMAILEGNIRAGQIKSQAMGSMLQLGAGAALAVGGTMAGSSMAATIGLALLSDKEVKTGVRFLRKLSSGVNLYAYKYIFDDERVEERVGVMAQEVEEIMPDAVEKGDDGFLRVNYAKLGLPIGSTHMGASV